MVTEAIVGDPMVPEDITMYRSVLMQVLYIASSRPDLSFETFLLSKGNPLAKGHKQANEVNTVIQRLKETASIGLFYKRHKGVR